jgi:hypothetical protein
VCPERDCSLVALGGSNDSDSLASSDTYNIFFTSAVLTLPIRTAASLPFAVLALLIYATRITPAGNQESS